jgi:hypothetical protein
VVGRIVWELDPVTGQPMRFVYDVNRFHSRSMVRHDMSQGGRGYDEPAIPPSWDMLEDLPRRPETRIRQACRACGILLQYSIKEAERFRSAGVGEVYCVPGRGLVRCLPG